MVEYAKRGNKLVKLVRLTAETLSGIPSIVYGLFGMMLFNIAFGWSYSMLAGICTLAIMILPLILRTTEEALISVPDSYREGSFGLGAGKLRTVFQVILPPAMPGILSGVILAIGRIVGESAALIFTSGSGKENLMFGKTGSFFADLFAPLFQSTRTLSVHMYNLMSEGLHMKEAQATAVVLLVLVVVINAGSARLAKSSPPTAEAESATRLDQKQAKRLPLRGAVSRRLTERCYRTKVSRRVSACAEGADAPPPYGRHTSPSRFACHLSSRRGFGVRCARGQAFIHSLSLFQRSIR